MAVGPSSVSAIVRAISQRPAAGSSQATTLVASAMFHVRSCANRRNGAAGASSKAAAIGLVTDATTLSAVRLIGVISESTAQTPSAPLHGVTVPAASPATLATIDSAVRSSRRSQMLTTIVV